LRGLFDTLFFAKSRFVFCSDNNMVARIIANTQHMGAHEFTMAMATIDAGSRNSHVIRRCIQHVRICRQLYADIVHAHLGTDAVVALTAWFAIRQLALSLAQHEARLLALIDQTHP
jgi:hypothetical protein